MSIFFLTFHHLLVEGGICFTEWYNQGMCDLVGGSGRRGDCEPKKQASTKNASQWQFSEFPDSL
jgi:hypothetical protein